MLDLLKKRDIYINQSVESMPVVLCEYVISFDGNFKCLYISPKCTKILGYNQEFFSEDKSGFWNLINKEDKNRILEAKKNSSHSSKFLFELRIETFSGEKRWVQLSALHEGRPGEMEMSWKGFVFDITDKKMKEEKPEQLAKKDSLTGIYNKRYFYKKIENEIMDFISFKTKFTLLFIDLDGFKRINDKFGHIIGDEVLRGFAEKTSKMIRAGDYLGRIGDDKFCVLIKNSGLKEGIIVASRFRESIEKTPITTNAGEIYITISGGVAEVGKDSLDALTLMEKADNALYMAKDIGKNTVVSVEE